MHLPKPPIKQRQSNFVHKFLNKESIYLHLLAFFDECRVLIKTPSAI